MYTLLFSLWFSGFIFCTKRPSKTVKMCIKYPSPLWIDSQSLILYDTDGLPRVEVLSTRITMSSLTVARSCSISFRCRAGIRSTWRAMSVLVTQPPRSRRYARMLLTSFCDLVSLM